MSNLARAHSAVSLTIFFSLALFTIAQADELKLTNGDQISGELIGIHGEFVEFETDYAGTLRIEKSYVATVSTEDEYEFIESTGTQSRARFTHETELEDIRKAWRPKLFGIGSISSIENTLALSASYSYGNNTTQVLLLETGTEITRAKSEHVFESAIHRDTAEGEELKKQIDFSYKTRRFLSDDWFYVFNLDAYQDAVKDIDLRLSPTLGLGHRYWENSYGKLTVEAGLAAVFEEIDGVRREQPAASWELDYSKRFYGGRLEAVHQHRVLIGSSDGYVIDSSNGVTVGFSDKIDLNLLAKLRHDTSVPVGSRETDIAYVAGIGLTF